MGCETPSLRTERFFVSMTCWRSLRTEQGWKQERSRVEEGRGGLRLGQSLRFPSPLIKPDVRICRVAQPLLAFAPTDPTMRRYRSGLFRKDPRRVDHCCHAWWIAGSGRGKAVRSWR